MEDIKYPKQFLDYRSIRRGGGEGGRGGGRGRRRRRRRRPEWPLRRLLDGYNCEAETSQLLAQVCDQKKKIRKYGK